MIDIIVGAKGTGKTKMIIDKANATLESKKGDAVFLTTTKRYRMEINPRIKFIDTRDEGIMSKDMLFGFIRGMLCANYDIEYFFIDGVYKMMNVTIDSAEMAELFMLLDTLGNASGVKFVLTISCDKEALPEFIAKYLA